MGEKVRGGRLTDLEDPDRCFLPYAQYPLCTDDTSLRIDRAVKDIDGNDMGALFVWIFTPDAQVDECPGMARGILCEKGRL